MARDFNQIISDIAEQYATEARERFFEMFIDQNHDYAAWSPIEQIMGHALLYYLKSSTYGDADGGMNEIGFEGDMKPFDDMSFSLDGERYGTVVYPQMKVGKYRADFLISHCRWKGKPVLGVVECDGHDFHERTKEQAQHDKERDRFFQSKGLIVLRYTGSEIFKDPIKCAVGAIAILDARSKQLVEGGR